MKKPVPGVLSGMDFLLTRTTRNGSGGVTVKAHLVHACAVTLPR